MKTSTVLWMGLSLALVACGDKDDDDTGGGPSDSGATGGDSGATGGDSGDPAVEVPALLSDCTAHDPVWVEGAAMDGDTLVVPVSYGGGCEEHLFSLCWPDQSFMESEPVQAQLYVWHENNDDMCEAIVDEELRFDLTAMRAQYEAGYPGGSGRITVHVDDQTVLWEL